MKKLLLIFFAFVFCVRVTAQEKTVRVHYNENSQKLVVNEPGYLLLSYDMYLCPAYTNEIIGPCVVDIKNDNPEAMLRFYDKVHPGDKVRMKNIKVMNLATKKLEKVGDYSIILK